MSKRDDEKVIETSYDAHMATIHLLTSETLAVVDSFGLEKGYQYLDAAIDSMSGSVQMLCMILDRLDDKEFRGVIKDLRDGVSVSEDRIMSLFNDVGRMRETHGNSRKHEHTSSGKQGAARPANWQRYNTSGVH